MARLPFPDDEPHEKVTIKKIKKDKAEKTKAEEENEGIIKRLFAVYHQAFLRKWNKCAVHGTLDCYECTLEAWTPQDQESLIKPLYEGGRDAKALKRLYEAWGESAVAELIQVFFESTDPMVTRSDYKVQVFFQQAQRLRLNAKQSQRPDARMTDNINAAANAMRRRL